MAAKCLGTLNFRLFSLSSRLSKEVHELEPDGMLSEALLQELDGLTVEEMEYVSDRLDEHILQTPLTVACSRGLTRVVKYLFQKGAPDISRLRWVDPYDLPPKKAPLLWVAVVNKYLSLVDILLNEGADINAVTCTGSTSLSTACWLGWKDMAIHLIHRGADVNKPNGTGSTCLMNAVADVTLCKILLRHGANLYARDLNQKTVLHHAIEGKRIETVDFLLGNAICRYEIDPRDAYELLISALLSGPKMYICLSFLYKYLSPGEKANVYEFWGCIVNETHSTTLSWLYASRIRSQYNVRKVIMPPKAAFEYRTECVSANKINSLASSGHFNDQIIMILMRILGPSHFYVIYNLETYMQRCADEQRHTALNRLCFLLLELKIERYGILSDKVTHASQLLVEHFEYSLEDSPKIPYLNFDVLFETLQLITRHLQANRVDILEFPVEEQSNFDWNLTFLLFLILLTYSVQKTARQDQSFRRYIHTNVLVCGEADGQLRTIFRGRTLLHLAVSSCTFPASFDEERRTITGVRIFPHLGTTELLLDCGAPINLADSEGCSPLFAAVSARNPDMKVAKMLLSRSAHLERIGPNGNLVMDVRNKLPPDCIKQLNLPRVLSLRCICALALTTTGITEDSIPPGLREFVKKHRR